MRYYFDFNIGEAWSRDEHGVEFASTEEMRDEAFTFLPTVATELHRGDGPNSRLFLQSGTQMGGRCLWFP
jgi:hypothetical protein